MSMLLTQYLMLNIYSKGGKDVSRPTVSHPLTMGNWASYAYPRGVYYNGKTYYGVVNQNGDVIVASQVDGQAMTLFTLKSALEVDNHAAPSIIFRASDHKLLAFYSKHDNTVMYQRISTNAEDISAWGSEADLASSIKGLKYTYPNPIQFVNEANSPIYLYYRDRDGPGNAVWSYSKSSDGGSTWSTGTAIFSDATSSYLCFASNGTDRVDFAASRHPQFDTSDKLWHWYYISGSYYKTDGTLITDSLPLSGSKVTQVYDSNPKELWVFDVARNSSNGNIAIVFSYYVSTSDHRYYYALWNGSNWTVNEIVANGGNISSDGGETYFSGGASIDPSDINTIYVGKGVSGVWEIWKYVTANSGSTWTGTAITSASAQHNYSPSVIRNYGSYAKVVWLNGIYVTYFDCKSQLKTSTL